MKVWAHRLLVLLLCALMLWASAGPLFAQKQFKYLPKALKATPKTKIPYAVNPKLPPAVRANFAMPLVRPNITPPVERVVAAQAITPVQAQSLVTPAVPVPQTAPALPTVPTPPTTTAEDTGTNLTGIQVLAQYFPTWRQELGAKFTKEQLDAVEKAFAATDEWMFVRGEDGELKARNKDEWDYEARFLTTLQNSGVSFTEKQIKQLIGGKAIRGFTFKVYFFRMKATGFSCAKDTKPHPDIWRNGRRLSRKEMAPEEVQEVIVGQGLINYRNHPSVIAYMLENRLHAESKTPEEYVALARQYPSKPRSEIHRGGLRLKREEMTPEEVQEVIVGQGLANYKNHPLVKAYLDENRLQAERKTPEEYVALARQYPTKPRTQISKNGHLLSREEMTPEEVQEVIVGQGLHSYRNHPLVVAYMKENRRYAEAQTTQQLYTSLSTHIKDYGHYPTWRKNSLYMNISNRLHRHQSTMIDGKYADPWLQKIYELKTLIQNAPDGKFTLTPDGQGGYTLEIEEPVTEEDVSAPQKVEEVAPAVPSRHALYEHITEDIKNMILQVRDRAALQRHEFYPWLKDMQQHHLDQIVGKDTSDALWALNRAISFDHKTGQNRRAVTYLLQTVNNYVGILGEDEQLGYFDKIIYRGKLEPGMLPQADLFHVVAEQEGMSWNGDIIPQVGDVNKAYAQAVKRGEDPGSYLEGDEDMVTAIGIAPRVPIQTVKQDLENMLKQLLPPGFEVRMGLHELGISGNNMTKFHKGDLHIHLERPATTEEMQDGFLTDVSISFKIQGLDRFVRKYNKTTQRVEARTDKEIAQNYLTLFGSFLDQAAKDKLSELAK